MNKKYSTKQVVLTSIGTTICVLSIIIGMIQNEKNTYKNIINRMVYNHQIELEDLKSSNEKSLNTLRNGFESEIGKIQNSSEGEIERLTKINMELLAQNKSLIEQLDSVHTVEDKLLKYRITLSHYTASVDETDSNPQETATGTKPVVGRTLAVSRDLFKYLRGKRVWIEGLGVFTVEDTMNPRYTNQGDLLVRTKYEAKKLGTKKVTMIVLPDKI